MTEGAILVTGATGALGSHLVVDLLRRGRQVLALGRSEPRVRAALERTAQAVGATWDSAALTAAGFSLDDAEGWQGLLGRLDDSKTPLAGAVLAAGGWAGGQGVSETPEAIWTSMLSGNLDSARLALARVLPVLERQQDGSVVLVGSRAAVRPWESRGAAAYASAKAAVVALAQTAAAEVLDAQVRVNVVLPSTLDTPANRAGRAHAEDLVSLDSLSGVIRFLLSPEARDISGAMLPVYGRA